jgi:hypothetical protein
VGSGWGTATTGGSWTIAGTASRWSVTPNAGTVSVAPGGQERGYLASTSVQDVEILQKVMLPKSSQGSSDLAYVLGRYKVGSTDSYYRIGIGQGGGNGTMFIRGQRSDGASLGADMDTGIATADGATVWLRVQFQGINPTAIRARAWLDGSAEPVNRWMLDTTDTNAAEQTAGAVGVRDRNEDTAVTHVFTHAGFQAVALAAPAAICPASAVACDTFQRTLSGSWGSADAGGAWNTSGGIFSVVPGQGRITVDRSAPQTFLSSVSIQDVDARAWISMPSLATTGDAGIAVRYGAAGGTYYQVSAYYPSSINAGKYVVQLKRKPENVQINPDFNTSIVGGTAIWLRLQATGINPTTLRWKIWQDGTPEPAAWTNAAEQGAGGIGVEGYIGGGTVTVPFNAIWAASPSSIGAAVATTRRSTRGPF